MKDCVFYTSHRCPICARLRWVLHKLEIRGLLHIITVDVGINRKNSLMDFYDYLRGHWGGERRVPVLKIGREVYMVSKFHTVLGKTPEIDNWDELDKQVLALEQTIIEDLVKAEPESEPYLTHELLKERITIG